MKLGKKIIVVLLFIIGIAGLLVGSIAYYRIVVSGSIEGSTGNAVFNVTGFKDDSSSIKTIELGKISPGDSGEFTITLDASGSTVDMYATLSIDRGDSSNNTELPTNLKFYTTPDHKSELHKYYSFLETTGTQKEELTIYWYWNPFISDEDDNKYINKSFNASINVSAVQISEYAMMKNGYSSSSQGGTEFWNSTYKPYIRTITFGNDLSNKPESCTGDSDLCWDVSYSSSQKKKVYAYLVDSGLKDSTDTTKSLYNLYIVSDAPIFAPASCSYMFQNFNNLITINFNNIFNTSKVTNMMGMFRSCSSLINLDLSNFNISKVTLMSGMFQQCSSLITLDLSSLNTSNVTNMNNMFSACSSLKNIDLSNFDTSKVTDMSDMFINCSSLTNLDLSCFNTSNVIGMSRMFEGCSSLTSMNLSNFNTSNVTNVFRMFCGCSSLTSLNLKTFNTSRVINMSGMFQQCSSLITLDLSSFNTSNVTNMSEMFKFDSSLMNLDLSNFNTSKVTDMSLMFIGCSSLISLNISEFDTSNVTSMQGMFQNCYKLQTQINIMNAGTTNYTSMFYGSLTDPNAYVILGYTTDTQSIAESMKITNRLNQSKITLKQI